MRKVWLIIKREYVTRVKTKGFVFGTIAVPVFSIGVMVLAIFLATRLTDRTVRLTIIDNVGGLANAVAAGLDARLPDGKPEFEVLKTVTRPPSQEPLRKELRAEIRNDRLDAYLVVNEGGKRSFTPRTRATIPRWNRSLAPSTRQFWLPAWKRGASAPATSGT